MLLAQSSYFARCRDLELPILYRRALRLQVRGQVVEPLGGGAGRGLGEAVVQEVWWYRLVIESCGDGYVS